MLPRCIFYLLESEEIRTVMKSVLIGIVVAVAVAFAAHAAYSNFAAENNNKTSVSQAAQPAPVAADAQQVVVVEESVVTETANVAGEPVVVKQVNTTVLAAAPATTSRPVVAKANTAKPASYVLVESPAANEPAKVQAAAVTQTQATPVTQAQKAQVANTAAKKEANTVKQVTKTNSTAKKVTATQDNSLSNPNSVAEYDFAFVNPEAVVIDPMTDVSGAAQQAVQNVYEETVLSPSAPRN